MKNLLIIFLALVLFSCNDKDKFERQKFDVLLTFQNKTNKPIDLYINEIDNVVKWEKMNLQPNETFDLKFNIRRDIKKSEGGFIFKAVFPNGKTIEKNTGYYTNYQYTGNNPSYIEVKEDDFNLRL